ncbi:DUF255 domain-containing protein, partial [Brachyspira hampsonii]|nr:DUF255 domain-containing protein [Brachyspira hampsonii]
MNKNTLIISIMIFISIVSCNKASAEIKWEKDLATAMKKAKEKNMPIMIDVYTDWCTWCKELDKNTYSHKDVIDAAKKMVSIKLNPETSEEGAKIAQRYGVQGFPTILFISADGFILENVGGYVEGE